MTHTVSEPVALAMLVLAAMLQCGAVAIGRLSPGIALGVAWAGAIVQMATGLDPLPFNLAILGVLYATAAWGSDRIFWAGLVSAFIGGITAAVYMVFVSGYLTPTLTNVPTMVVLAFMGVLALGSPWLGGFGWRMVLRWRATREAQTLAEVATAEEQERVHIARDMHDVVAHSLAVVIAQADGARYAQASDPEATGAALTTISTTAREALSDVRILLGQLRHSQGESPQPVLEDLDRLLDQLRSAGLTIARSDSGTAVPLGTSQQLAVYRIVQEALTNALRHGDTDDEVQLTLVWGQDGVHVTVANELKATPAAPLSAGHGLVGMRERATLVGGWLTAEPRQGQFIVMASIPAEAAE